MGPTPKPLSERFNGKWIAEPFSGCWIWTGACVGDRYGAIKEGGKKIGAHVASWNIHKGEEVPAGMFVCHRCDTPLCVNPNHLFLATHQENIQDCVSKNRHAIGERNPFSRLNREQVDTIRSSDLSPAYLAEQFGVSRKTIIRVRSGETWKYAVSVS